MWALKSIITISFISILFGCNPKAKNPTTPVPPVTGDTTKKHLGDSVLENKQMDEYSIAENTRRKPRPPKPTPGEPPVVVTPVNGCFFLDFNGHNVSGTMWNVRGDFLCAPSGLNSTGEQTVFDRVVNYYAVFNPYILITRDENVFNSYPVNKRRRIVITTTMPDGFQNQGGVAYLNSFGWFDNSPAFVNSAGLNFNPKNISDACGHEAGHTLGCRHQSDWRYNVDGSCYKYSDYLWANLIMGASYQDPNPVWGIGANSLGCTVIQNDTAVIFATLRK